MKEAHVLFVSNEDDWEGVYINGLCEDQGHSLRKTYLLERLVGCTVASVSYRVVNGEWLYEEGGLLPYEAEDIVFK